MEQFHMIINTFPNQKLSIVKDMLSFNRNLKINLQGYFSLLMNKNTRRKQPEDTKEVCRRLITFHELKSKSINN